MPPPIRIELLDGFRLLEGEERVALARGSEQLLAFLALRPRPVRRKLVAGVLWSHAGDERASANLRAALSRLDPVSRRAITLGELDLSIAEHVAVDIRDVRALARGLLEPESRLDSSSSFGLTALTLSGDLLPGWYDDWVLGEATEWTQLSLCALETFARKLTAANRFGQAAMAARAAIRNDPLRESAYAALIETHVAEGNRVAAVCVLRNCERILNQELGLRPANRLYQLLSGTLSADGARLG